MKIKLLSTMVLGVAALSGACGSSPANSNTNSNAKPAAATPANVSVVPATPANVMPPNSAANGNANSAARKPPVSGVDSNSKIDPRTTLTDDDVPPANTAKKKK